MTTLDTLQGRVVATVGSTANTGFVPWVVSLRVQLGPYYFVVCPLSGQRRLEVRLQLPLEVHASRVYTSTATSLSATKTTTAAIRTTAVATTTTPPSLPFVLCGFPTIQQCEASEIFRVANPSATTAPPLAVLSPALDEYVAMGATFPVAWTSPSIERCVYRQV